jgi:hypothetical protein
LDLEAALVRAFTDDDQLAAEDLGSPIDHAAGEALIRPVLLDLRVVEPGPQERSTGAVAVLDVRGDDVDRNEQAEGVGDQEPLATLDLLAGVEVPGYGGDGVSGADDCETIRPALGPALRPSVSRTLSRSASSTRSTVSPPSHQVKYQYTVCQGGKSFGSCRQAHRVRTT